MVAEERRRPQPGELQDLGAVDCPGGEDHPAPRPDRQRLAATRELDPLAEQPAVRAVPEAEPPGLRPGPDREVRPALRGAQEGARGVPAPAAPLVHLEIAHPLVVAVVEVRARGDARLLRRRAEGVEDLPAQPLLLDPPFAVRAVQPVERRIRPRPGAPVALVGDEIRQDAAPGPVRLAGQLRPGVVVARLAAHVDHAVDRGASAQHPPARIAQAATVQPRLGLGRIHPVGARVADAVEIADGDVDPGIIVPPPRLDQQHAPLARGAQPVGQEAARRAGPDDDVIEFLRHASIYGRGIGHPQGAARGRLRFGVAAPVAVI